MLMAARSSSATNIGVDGATYCALEFTGPVLRELPISGRFTMANMSIEAGAKNGIFAVDAVAAAVRDAAIDEGIARRALLVTDDESSLAATSK